MWVLLTNAGARAGVGPPTGLRRIPATLVVAEQHSLSPESNPPRAPIHRPVATSPLALLLPPAPPGSSQGRLASSLGPGGHMSPRHRRPLRNRRRSGRGLPAGHQPLRLKTSGPMKAFGHPHSCREPLFSATFHRTGLRKRALIVATYEGGLKARPSTQRDEIATIPVEERTRMSGEQSRTSEDWRNGVVVGSRRLQRRSFLLGAAGGVAGAVAAGLVAPGAAEAAPNDEYDPE